MGIIANLVPREGKFFEYFNEHASRIAAASRELVLLLSEYADVPARAGRVRRQETGAGSGQSARRRAPWS